MATSNYETAKTAGQKYFGEFSLIATFFVVVVTISNIAYRIFDFRLLPFFQIAFDTFHEFCHLFLQLFVFSWLTTTIGYLCYGLTWLASLLLPIAPWFPHIRIPPLLTDIGLVSLAFTRVFQSADLIVPRERRQEAERSMTAAMWNEIVVIEGHFWGPLHRATESINTRIWAVITYITKLVGGQGNQRRKLAYIVRVSLITIAGAVLMWGFVRLAGYLINVSAARSLKSPMMVIRREFFKYFIVCLAGAIAATLVFIVLNGWLAEWTDPSHHAN